MKIIVKDRAMGKTTQLVYTSEATGYPIVAANEDGIETIKSVARELACNIPDPMTVEQVKLGFANGHDNILVDEICMGGMLRDALNKYFGRNVVACTCSPDYVDPKARPLTPLDDRAMITISY